MRSYVSPKQERRSTSLESGGSRLGRRIATGELPIPSAIPRRRDVRVLGRICPKQVVSKTATPGSIPGSPAFEKPRLPATRGFSLCRGDCGVMAARGCDRIDPLESARPDPFLSTGLSTEPGLGEAGWRKSDSAASQGAADALYAPRRWCRSRRRAANSIAPSPHAGALFADSSRLTVPKVMPAWGCKFFLGETALLA